MYLQMKKGQPSKSQANIDAELECLEAELCRPSEGLKSVEHDEDEDEDDLLENASNNHNEVVSEPDVPVENTNSAHQRNVRGRTILEAIHNRNVEDRDPIILNDRHQPIGPTKDVVRTYKNFLGTVAKNAKLAPLNYVKWPDVPDKIKENIWEYIQRRYLVPEVGKKKVLSKIGSIWRQNKCRLKAVHYTAFENMEDRLKFMPDTVPEPQWKELMQYWALEEVEETSKKNKDNRSKQGDMHTMGTISFAELRHELQQNDPDKKEPSLTDMYVNTRKRKVGHTYLTSNDETLQNIEKMEALKAQSDGNGMSDPYYKVITKKEHSGRLRLHGHGVTKSSLKNKSNTPYVLPSVFVDSITQTLEKKMEDHLESKMAYMLSKIREANPGIDIVVPDFQTMEGDASSPHETGGESSDHTHPS